MQSETFKSTEICLEAKKMHNVLAAIAEEIQSFYVGMSTSRTNSVFNEIVKYRLKFITMQKKIKRLKENVKICYVVAQFLLPAKKNESSESAIKHLKSRIEFGQGVSVDSSSLMHDILKKKMYQPLNGLFTQQTLNKIVTNYQQYHIKYYDECAKSKMLKQKNRFLQKRVNILENILTTLIKDIKSLRYDNLRLQKEKDSYENKMFIKSPDIASDKSNHSYKLEENLYIGSEEISTFPRLNLKCHLIVVKKLLIDQKNMLQDLKSISEHINQLF